MPEDLKRRQSAQMFGNRWTPESTKPRVSPAPAPDPETLLRQKDAAGILSVSQRTMENWRQVGGGPTYIRISCRCIRYRRADLTVWIEECARQNTSEGGQI